MNLEKPPGVSRANPKKQPALGTGRAKCGGSLSVRPDLNLNCATLCAPRGAPGQVRRVVSCDHDAVVVVKVEFGAQKSVLDERIAGEQTVLWYVFKSALAIRTPSWLRLEPGAEGDTSPRLTLGIP